MPTPPHAIGLLHHPKKPESLTLAAEMAEYFSAHGCDVWSGSAWDEPEALSHVSGLELLITLGGDGTVLRAARLGSSYGVPILGVKLGRVSFLAEIQPDDWRRPFGMLLDGCYWLEERMLLDVAVVRTSQEPGQAAPGERLSSPGGPAGAPAPCPSETPAAHLPRIWQPPDHNYLALNDVVVSRGGLARLVTVETWVDHSYLTSYRADGIIVATPTGCTGYALAAGGPILPPELKNILLIPICPHLSLDRPIVLSQGATVTLQVYADHPAILTVDGQFEISLADADRIEVRASPHVSQFVHMQDRAYFYRTLMERLRW